MPAYTLDIAPQDNIQFARCKLHSLERKCFSKVEKLKLTLEEHLQNGIPASDLLEKTVSFFAMKKAVVFPGGYSRCTRDVLRMCPSPTEDVEPLFCQE
ncbi:hypothetical protein AMEX_G26449 [Astyanax mexicanus]|uniref:Uncharacterized protein n=1 Tax=Astyanax mexicanus TaxID=7994 RepID=A0A8T2KNE9_ASTMX|nr:hypothetical protein AMEX_G26449 [Astyanax mexicanus]